MHWCFRSCIYKNTEIPWFSKYGPQIPGSVQNTLRGFARYRSCIGKGYIPPATQAKRI